MPRPSRALPAAAFRAGDTVVATDADGPHFGEVQHTPAELTARDEVLVQWADDDAEADAAGLRSPAARLRLWPPRTHSQRVRNFRAST